jgi:hypothetical protein
MDVVTRGFGEAVEGSATRAWDVNQGFVRGQNPACCLSTEYYL